MAPAPGVDTRVPPDGPDVLDAGDGVEGPVGQELESVRGLRFRTQTRHLPSTVSLKEFRGYPEHTTDWCGRLNESMLQVIRFILEYWHHGRAC
jgi:hypothetical protein